MFFIPTGEPETALGRGFSQMNADLTPVYILIQYRILKQESSFPYHKDDKDEVVKNRTTRF
jgi:hypothetical protein